MPGLYAATPDRRLISCASKPSASARNAQIGARRRAGATVCAARSAGERRPIGLGCLVPEYHEVIGSFDAGAGWSEWGGGKGGWMQVQEAYRAVCLGYDMRNFCITYTVCTYVLLLR